MIVGVRPRTFLGDVAARLLDRETLTVTRACFPHCGGQGDSGTQRCLGSRGHGCLVDVRETESAAGGRLKVGGQHSISRPGRHDAKAHQR